MRVGLDLDGVCYDWVSAANRALEIGKGLAGLEPHLYWGHLDDQVKERLGVDGASQALRWLWTEGVSEMFGADHAYPGAPSFMRELARHHELVVITSRPRTAAHLTLRFLARHKVNAAEVHVIGSGKSKADIDECAVYVEDRDQNVKDLCRNTAGFVLCPNRAWNQDAFDDGGMLSHYERIGSVVRYNDFSEALSFIKDLEESHA